MNKALLIGNLTKEPELRYTTSDNPKAICNFSIAVNEGYGENKKTYFFNITAWGKTAENVDRYCTKGSKVAIDGSLYTDTYEKDGQKKYVTGINAHTVEFLPKGEMPNNVEKNISQSSEVPTGYSALQEDDIPF